MFYLNEKNIKEYTTINFLKTEKFLNFIKPKIMSLIKKEYIKQNNVSLTLFEEKQKITPSIPSRLSEDSIQKINKNFSYLGKWSEFFIEKLINFYKSNNLDYNKPINLKENWFLIKEATEESKKYFKIKSTRKESIFWFLDLENLNKNKYSFFLEKEEFENHDNQLIFMTIMNHFQAFLPYCENFMSWDEFTKTHSLKTSEEYSIECEVSRWEFDFFDIKENYLIDLKFQRKGWDINWIWQLLLYVYLLDFYYGKRSQGISVLNTFTGEIWKISLKNLFIEGGDEKFFKVMKTEIQDYEKIRLMNRILSCFKEWDQVSNLKEIISNNFFIQIEDQKINEYEKFILKLNSYRNNSNFLSNIHSSKWVWNEWNEFLSSNQLKN
ncbi:hypothetical protein [Mycoplasma parvum]|uniref:Uncharacterized protein n=1 Tax=Mycoplasma parvum str. Indiana TaxID=1403316 RepID=U5NC10_9MOLU|nr:hypothetical protein [Mycoplasma parvum]AGX89111.1 hypothetical protein PRV_01850 [Mycoplasma parvum str. Indiana]